MKASAVTEPSLLAHLARARLQALTNAPYMASALIAMVFFQVDDLKTICVDAHLRIYLDPVTVMTWSTDELAGALLHESHHFVRSHHSRAPAGPWNDDLWNVAADLEINDDLETANVTLPVGALTPVHMGLEPNRTAEWYFDRLVREVVTVRVCCGSGATGTSKPWELDSDESGVSRLRATAIVDDVAESVRRAPPGSTPGGLTRWAQAHHHDVPWERVLRSAVLSAASRSCGQIDYSWSSPNRRHRGRAILPRLRGTKATVLCIVDTSGSMSQVEIDAALGEVLAVARATAVERTFVASCDTSPTFHGDVRSVTALEFVGGGGTSLENALSIIDQYRLDPEIVVFLTDGMTSWSTEPPTALAGRRTIVVTPAGNPTGPSWADSVVCRNSC